MELTAFAQWLNTAFAEFDGAILEFYHNLATHAAFIVTPVMDFFSLIGDNGYFCFVLALLLFCFPKTRMAGVCILFSIAFGAIFTNLTLKELIARPRPFQADYADWWTYVGAPHENEFSFPSGHVTAAMACMTAVCLSLRKKWLLAPAALYVLLMAAARNYLMVHYPTDVIGGMLVGGVAAVIGFFLARALWRLFEKRGETSVCQWMLTADLRHLWQSNKN